MKSKRQFQESKRQHNQAKTGNENFALIKEKFELAGNTHKVCLISSRLINPQ